MTRSRCSGCGKLKLPFCVEHEGKQQVVWSCPDNLTVQLNVLDPGVKRLGFGETGTSPSIVIEDAVIRVQITGPTKAQIAATAEKLSTSFMERLQQKQQEAILPEENT